MVVIMVYINHIATQHLEYTMTTTAKTLTNAERLTSCQEVIATFREILASYDAALELRAGHIDGVNDAFLIRTSQGIYTKAEGGKTWGCGALHATRYTWAQARRLAPLTRNGAGAVGEPVNVWDALETDRADIAKQIEGLEAMAGKLAE